MSRLTSLWQLSGAFRCSVLSAFSHGRAPTSVLPAFFSSAADEAAAGDPKAEAAAAGIEDHADAAAEHAVAAHAQHSTAMHAAEDVTHTVAQKQPHLSRSVLRKLRVLGYVRRVQAYNMMVRDREINTLEEMRLRTLTVGTGFGNFFGLDTASIDMIEAERQSLLAKLADVPVQNPESYSKFLSYVLDAPPPEYRESDAADHAVLHATGATLRTARKFKVVEEKGRKALADEIMREVDVQACLPLVQPWFSLQDLGTITSCAAQHGQALAVDERMALAKYCERPLLLYEAEELLAAIVDATALSISETDDDMSQADSKVADIIRKIESSIADAEADPDFLVKSDIVASLHLKGGAQPRVRRLRGSGGEQHVWSAVKSAQQLRLEAAALDTVEMAAARDKEGIEYDVDGDEYEQLRRIATAAQREESLYDIAGHSIVRAINKAEGELLWGLDPSPHLVLPREFKPGTKILDTRFDPEYGDSHDVETTNLFLPLMETDFVRLRAEARGEGETDDALDDIQKIQQLWYDNTGAVPIHRARRELAAGSDDDSDDEATTSDDESSTSGDDSDAEHEGDDIEGGDSDDVICDYTDEEDDVGDEYDVGDDVSEGDLVVTGGEESGVDDGMDPMIEQLYAQRMAQLGIDDTSAASEVLGLSPAALKMRLLDDVTHTAAVSVGAAAAAADASAAPLQQTLTNQFADMMPKTFDGSLYNIYPRLSGDEFSNIDGRLPQSADVINEFLDSPSIHTRWRAREMFLSGDEVDDEALEVHQWEQRMVLHVGPRDYHPANRRVKLRMHARRMQDYYQLSNAALRHVLWVCEQRYNPRTGVLKLTCAHHADREDNRREIMKWVHALVVDAHTRYPNAALQRRELEQQQRLLQIYGVATDMLRDAAATQHALANSDAA